MPPQELLDLKAELVYGFKITEKNHEKLGEHKKVYWDVFDINIAVAALSRDLGFPSIVALRTRTLGRRTQHKDDCDRVVSLGKYTWYGGKGHMLCYCIYDVLPQLMEKLGVTEGPQWYPLGR